MLRELLNMKCLSQNEAKRAVRFSFNGANKVIPTGIYGHVAPGAGLPQHFPIIVCPEMAVVLPMWMARSG